MSISTAYNSFLNYNELIVDHDEFLPVVVEFAREIGCEGFLYFSTTSNIISAVSDKSIRQDTIRQFSGVVLKSYQNSGPTLVDPHNLSLRLNPFGKFFKGLLSEDFSTGFSSWLQIRCAQHRKAHFILIGLKDTSVHESLCRHKIFPLLGLECDRRFRQLSTFRLEEKSILSAQERRCLVWASQGKNMEEIGEIMSIKRRTVEFHITNARKKLGAVNVTNAVYQATQSGILL